MDHTAEASMEEILASIRRIIASEPKAVKAFADEHFQKSSDPSQQSSSQGLEKSSSSFRNDFSRRPHGQEPTLKVEPSFSSLSTSSSASSKVSPNLTNRPSSQSFAEALDRDLAGLLETPQTAQQQSKEEYLEKNISTEDWSKSISYPKFSDVSSKASISNQDEQTEDHQTLKINSDTSLVKGGVAKKEPQFYPSLTSGDFLNGETIPSKPLNTSAEFVISPTEPLVAENNISASFTEDMAGKTFLDVPNLATEIKDIPQALQNPVSQEQISFSKLSTDGSSLKESLNFLKEAPNTYQMSVPSAEEVVLNAQSQKNSQRSFEDVVSDMLRPMLEAWVEKNLPHLVPKLLKIDNA